MIVLREGLAFILSFNARMDRESAATKVAAMNPAGIFATEQP